MSHAEAVPDVGTDVLMAEWSTGFAGIVVHITNLAAVLLAAERLARSRYEPANVRHLWRQYRSRTARLQVLLGQGQQLLDIIGMTTQVLQLTWRLPLMPLLSPQRGVRRSLIRLAVQVRRKLLFAHSKLQTAHLGLCQDEFDLTAWFYEAWELVRDAAAIANGHQTHIAEWLHHGDMDRPYRPPSSLELQVEMSDTDLSEDD